MFGAGPNEELIFRSFLVGLLAVFVPGCVRADAFEVGAVMALMTWLG